MAVDGAFPNKITGLLEKLETITFLFSLLTSLFLLDSLLVISLQQNFLEVSFSKELVTFQGVILFVVLYSSFVVFVYPLVRWMIAFIWAIVKIGLVFTKFLVDKFPLYGRAIDKILYFFENSRSTGISVDTLKRKAVSEKNSILFSYCSDQETKYIEYQRKWNKFFQFLAAFTANLIVGTLVYKSLAVHSASWLLPLYSSWEPKTQEIVLTLGVTSLLILLMAVYQGILITSTNRSMSAWELESLLDKDDELLKKEKEREKVREFQRNHFR